MVTTISNRDNLIINNFINLFCRIGGLYSGEVELIRVSQKWAHRKTHPIKDYQEENLDIYKQADLQY